MTIVSPSRWLADCARGSLLFRDAPVHVIPDPMDLALWPPIPQAAARTVLGLPLDARLILFGADGGLGDPRKGGRELRSALAHLAAGGAAEAQLLIYGQGQPRRQDQSGDWPGPVHWLGRIRDDRVLVLAYAAADVMVVPSLQDNLPNTAIEAQCCGTPVAGFAVGGLPDIVEHEQAGYLARPFDIKALAQGIQWVLQDADRHAAMREVARQRAQALFDRKRIADLYRAVYREALAS